jgi:hypothetical protein
MINIEEKIPVHNVLRCAPENKSSARVVTGKYLLKN